MRIQGARPTLIHADTHTSYLPRDGVNRFQMAANVAEQITQHKIKNPGSNIYDRLVDQLVLNVKAGSSHPQLQAEDDNWSPPQRIVWRCASKLRMPLSPEAKLAIIADRRVDKKTKAYAVVNGGKWIVRCPFPGCNSAQAASWDDPRYFCVDCGNTGNGGRWVEVTWPTNPHEIEVQLESRPIEVRGWEWGETREELKHQDAVAMGQFKVDTSSWPKTQRMVLPDGTDLGDVPVLHYGTPEWDAAQKGEGSPTAKELEA